jgi:hypothetical protein
MRNALLGVILAGLTFFALPSFAQNMHSEMNQHPRIQKAVAALEDAIKYMQAAPHDFGGHKEQAIADSQKAVQQLREAMKYRAKQDKK